MYRLNNASKTAKITTLNSVAKYTVTMPVCCTSTLTVLTADVLGARYDKTIYTTVKSSH